MGCSAVRGKNFVLINRNLPCFCRNKSYISLIYVKVWLWLLNRHILQCKNAYFNTSREAMKSKLGNWFTISDTGAEEVVVALIKMLNRFLYAKKIWMFYKTQEFTRLLTAIIYYTTKWPWSNFPVLNRLYWNWNIVRFLYVHVALSSNGKCFQRMSFRG